MSGGCLRAAPPRRERGARARGPRDLHGAGIDGNNKDQKLRTVTVVSSAGHGLSPKSRPERRIQHTPCDVAIGKPGCLAR